MAKSFYGYTSCRKKTPAKEDCKKWGKSQMGNNTGSAHCGRIAIPIIVWFCIVQTACSNPVPSAETLLDEFVDGKIAVEITTGDNKRLYIKDLLHVVDYDDWQNYSIGDRLDLDNDGEDELVMNGPNGGMIIDAMNGKLGILAKGEGTAGILSYTKIGGDAWIIHSDTTHGGRIMYIFDKYDGTRSIVDSMELSAEFWDSPDGNYNESSSFMFNGRSITMKEFDKLKYEFLKNDTNYEADRIVPVY